MDPDGGNHDASLPELFEGSAPEVYTIGDCKKPHLIAEAVRDGWKTAHEI